MGDRALVWRIPDFGVTSYFLLMEVPSEERTKMGAMVGFWVM
jgi:hypothetical protein